MIKLERTHQATDIIHGNILYSGLESAIISNPIMNRLHNILQSSLVYLTFSSNKVSRFEHSLGVMQLAGDILYHSISNTHEQDTIAQFIQETKDGLTHWFQNLDFMSETLLHKSFADLYSIETLQNIPYPLCNIYLDKTPKNIKTDDIFYYVVVLQAVRIAGLLHDIGHLPYSHIFEHAINNLYNNIKYTKKRNTAQDDFLSIMQDYCEDTKELHEEIGLTLIKQIKTEVYEELSKQTKSKENLFVSAVFYFIEKILSSSDNTNSYFSDLHSIVAGALDADRLDYCSRDAYCAGLSKDIFPYHRFISNYKITLVKKQFLSNTKRKSIVFCPALKNVSEVENLLERRWEIYSKINYHHRVHKHEVIFAEILSQIGYGELQSCDGNIPDLVMGKPLPLSLMSVWSIVKKLKSNNSLIDYYIIQIDDGWMDTFLKHAFFKKYQNTYRTEDENLINPEWNKFNELISTKKHYNSLCKRSVDFVRFDQKFGTMWLDFIKKQQINDLFIKRATKMIEINNASKSKRRTAYQLLNYKIISSIFLPQKNDDFLQEVEKSVNYYLKSTKGKWGVIDCMIRSCDFSLGLSERNPIYFWQENDPCVNFHTVSSERKILQSKANIYLPFHIYYLPSEAEPQLDKLEKKIIQIMISTLAEYIA